MPISSNLKFARDPNYASEEFTLNKIETELSKQKVILLNGVPGVGKTSLANELAYRLSANHVVYWIDAGSEFKVNESFKLLAHLLNENKSNIISQINAELKKSAKKCVFILDNAENINYIEEYILSLSPNANFLITTRDQSLFNQIESIQIVPFSTEFAKKYLGSLVQKRGRSESELDKLIEVLREKFGSLLAIEIEAFACYLRENELIDIECVKSANCMHSLIFEFLLENSKDAWRLLAYAAYFDGDFVHLTLMQQLHKNAIEQIELLKKLSLLKEAQFGENNGFVVHEIVQEKFKSFIKLKGENERSFIRDIRTVLVDGLSSNNEGFLRIMIYLHAKKLIKYKDFMDNEEKVEFLSKVSAFQRQLNVDIRNSIELENEIFELGGKNEVAEAILNCNLGLCYKLMGEYEKALEFLLKSYEKLTKITGENREDLVELCSNIGACFDCLGQFEQALQFHLKSIENFKELSGEEDNKRLAELYSNIGKTFMGLKKFNEALENLKKALELYSEGVEVYCDISACYLEIDDCDEAIKNCERFIEARKVRGEEKSAEIASALSCMAECFERKGLLAEAIANHQKSVQMRIELFGEMHADVAVSFNNLAECFRVLERFSDALESNERSLKIFRQIFGEKHANVATSLNNIALCHSGMGKHDDALKCSKMSVDIVLEVFGDKDIEAATSFSNLAACYANLGLYEDAVRFHEKCLPIFVANFGENHVNVAAVYSNLALCYDALDMYEDELDSLVKCADVLKAVHGDTHADLAAAYENLGEFYKMFGMFQMALEFFRNSRNILVKLFGEQHEFVDKLTEKIKEVEDEIESETSPPINDFSESCKRIFLFIFFIEIF